MVYNPGQAKTLFPYWPKEAEWFVIGGPSDADEAQTVVRQYPHVRCVGFEPNHEFVRFQEGMTFPGKVHRYALWELNTTLTLQVPDTLRRSSSVCRDLTGLDFLQEKVTGRTLDSLSEEFGPFDNCVLWLDVEHAEGAALRGAEGLFKVGKVLLVNVEVWDETYHEIDPLLKNYGFEVVHVWGRTVRDKRDVIYRRM